jgi:hypothetical protein
MVRPFSSLGLEVSYSQLSETEVCPELCFPERGAVTRSLGMLRKYQDH